MLSLLHQVKRGLLSNLVRTSLTVLGIVIGIATVVIVFSAGAGFQSYLQYQLDQFGSNTVYIETRVPPSTKKLNSGSQGGGAGVVNTAITTLKLSDLQQIKKFPHVTGVYGGAVGQKTVSYGNVRKSGMFMGVSADRFNIDKGKFFVGQGFTQGDEDAAAQVTVLGYDIASDLFGDPSQAMGKLVRIGPQNFSVVGVYERRGSFGFSNDDQQLFIPVTTAQKKLLGVDYLFFAVAQIDKPEFIEGTSEDMRYELRSLHNIDDPKKDDFQVTTQASALETFQTILSGAQLLLLIIAAISLLVGGVGIMNIMYVSVTERIAEIGLKKALGATPKRILQEFLAEAVVLTLLGAVIGLAIGALLSYVVAAILTAQNFPWQFSVPLIGVTTSLVISIVIGVGFGVFPAWQASKLSPIEALKSE